VFARPNVWFAAGLMLALSLPGKLLASELDSFRFRTEPVSPLPAAEVKDPERVAFGQALFFDRRLSDDGQLSCGDCHPLPPISAQQQVEPLLPSKLMGKHQRSLNLLYNIGDYYWLNWDGRYQRLETLVANAVTDLDKLNSEWPELLARLAPDYQAQARQLYRQDLSQAVVTDALVQFLRSLRTEPSAFDRFLQGDSDALSSDQQRGYEIFKRVGCSSCHNGRLLGGNLFQTFYIYGRDQEAKTRMRLKDQGRFYVTGDESDRNSFRVASLRNIAVTAPYFHDGSVDNLKEAVQEMAEHQLGQELNENQLRLLVDFLTTLTGSHSGYVGAE
jgi:cytochrome c peroxidase